MSGLNKRTGSSCGMCACRCTPFEPATDLNTIQRHTPSDTIIHLSTICESTHPASNSYADFSPRAAHLIFRPFSRNFSFCFTSLPSSSCTSSTVSILSFTMGIYIQLIVFTSHVLCVSSNSPVLRSCTALTVRVHKELFNLKQPKDETTAHVSS
jgi:hypothetical protein